MYNNNRGRLGVRRGGKAKNKLKTTSYAYSDNKYYVNYLSYTWLSA
jgi:hypothetical protein